jgi:hypothetical protein
MFAHNRSHTAETSPRSKAMEAGAGDDSDASRNNCETCADTKAVLVAVSREYGFDRAPCPDCTKTTNVEPEDFEDARNE